MAFNFHTSDSKYLKYLNEQEGNKMNSFKDKLRVTSLIQNEEQVFEGIRLLRLEPNESFQDWCKKHGFKLTGTKLEYCNYLYDGSKFATGPSIHTTIYSNANPSGNTQDKKYEWTKMQFTIPSFTFNGNAYPLKLDINTPNYHSLPFMHPTINRFDSDESDVILHISPMMLQDDEIGKTIWFKNSQRFGTSGQDWWSDHMDNLSNGDYFRDSANPRIKNIDENATVGGVKNLLYFHDALRVIGIYCKIPHWWWLIDETAGENGGTARVNNEAPMLRFTKLNDIDHVHNWKTVIQWLKGSGSENLKIRAKVHGWDEPVLAKMSFNRYEQCNNYLGRAFRPLGGMTSTFTYSTDKNITKVEDGSPWFNFDQAPGGLCGEKEDLINWIDCRSMPTDFVLQVIVKDTEAGEGAAIVNCDERKVYYRRKSAAENLQDTQHAYLGSQEQIFGFRVVLKGDDDHFKLYSKTETVWNDFGRRQRAYPARYKVGGWTFGTTPTPLVSELITPIDSLQKVSTTEFKRKYTYGDSWDNGDINAINFIGNGRVEIFDTTSESAASMHVIDTSDTGYGAVDGLQILDPNNHKVYFSDDTHPQKVLNVNPFWYYIGSIWKDDIKNNVSSWEDDDDHIQAIKVFPVESEDVDGYCRLVDSKNFLTSYCDDWKTNNDTEWKERATAYCLDETNTDPSLRSDYAIYGQNESNSDFRNITKTECLDIKDKIGQDLYDEKMLEYCADGIGDDGFWVTDSDWKHRQDACGCYDGYETEFDKEFNKKLSDQGHANLQTECLESCGTASYLPENLEGVSCNQQICLQNIDIDIKGDIDNVELRGVKQDCDIDVNGDTTNKTNTAGDDSGDDSGENVVKIEDNTMLYASVSLFCLLLIFMVILALGGAALFMF